MDVLELQRIVKRKWMRKSANKAIKPIIPKEIY